MLTTSGPSWITARGAANNDKYILRQRNIWIFVSLLYLSTDWCTRALLLACCCPVSQSLGNLKRYSFCLFVVVSESLWRRVGWELPGYVRLIFHICITRFNNSVTHEISVTVRFILCETTMACFRLCRLLNSLTEWIVLVVSSDM